MDSFVNEADFNLLQNDKYTFFVLARILHGNCNFVLSNHKSFIICHSCSPFPLWIWTSDNISQSEKEEIYKILDKNSFLNGNYTFNLKYDFAEFLINRAKKENKTLSIHKNLFAYDCPSPIEPTDLQKADGTFSKATIDDLEDFIDLWDWFHTELKIDMKTREEYCKDAEYSLKNENVFLWKNSQGKIVACCRYNVNDTVASIGLVYTHPDFRRKHYAQNLVYQVAKIISDQGLTPMLYTDADYIASNSCYEKIGFILRGKLCTLK